MGVFGRFTQAASAAYDAVRSVTSRIPDGAIVYDPASAIRWVEEYTPRRLAQIQARRDWRSVIQLCDAMLTDDRLRTVVFMRAQALQGADLEFVAGEGRRKNRALRAAEAESDYWDMIPETEFGQLYVWGLLANAGTGRLRWWEQRRDGRYVPRVRNGRLVPQLEFWHPANYRLDLTARQWIAQVETPGSTMPVDRNVDFEGGEHVMLCPWGGAGDVSRGLWSPAAKMWLLKQHVIASWATLGQRLGEPIKVVEWVLGQQGVDTRVEAGADAKRKQLVEELFTLQKRGVVSLPPGFTMKLLAVPATSAQMFKDQLAACDTALAILFLGQNLTTEIKGGSLAAAQIANLILGHLRRFDAAAESSFVRESILSLWSEKNFGAAEAAPWPMRQVNPPEDRAVAAKTLLDLAKAVETFEKNGWLVSKKTTDERFEIGLVEGQPDTVAKAPTTPTNTDNTDAPSPPA